MSYIKIQKILKESVDVPEQGYIYFGYDDEHVGGAGKGIWIKDDDGSVAYYVLNDLLTDPTITSFSPAISSFDGDTITINGTNFINSPLTTVTFDGVLGTYVDVKSVTQLTVVVPNVLGSVPVVVITPYGESTPVTYIIEAKDRRPIIQTVAPSQSPSGYDIVIDGVNFVQNDTIAFFGGISGITTFVNTTRIIVTVPEMSTGQTILFLQTTDGGAGNDVDFEVIPNTNTTFTNFSPTIGYIGDIISLSGTNFVTSETQVRFGSTQASGITVHDDTFMTAIIAEGTPFGATSIRVDVVSLSGFTVTGSTVDLIPTILSISPLDAEPGDPVVLSGTNLDGSLTITFSDVLVNGLTNISSTECSFIINSSTTPGINSVVVINKYGSSVPFDYAIPNLVGGPVINSFYPTSAYRNDPVNLNGTNFTVGVGNVVYYSNLNAQVSVNATDILVKTEVPTLAKTGSIDVKIVNVNGSYTKSGFIVNSLSYAPVISRISPVFARSGDTIDIYGLNLSNSTISFGYSYPGTNSVVTVISGSHVKAVVPYGFTSAGESRIVNIYASNSGGTDTFEPFDIYSEPLLLPVITSFSSNEGVVGSLLIIYGSNFSKYWSDISIFIGGSYYLLDNQTFVSTGEIRGYIPYVGGSLGPAFIKVSTQAGYTQKAGFTIVTLLNCTLIGTIDCFV